MASFYNNSIPVFIRSLNNLSAILKKAESWAEGKKIGPSVIANLRLAPDMLPFSTQVQIACDVAKGFASRISGVTNPSFADTESTLSELQERIAKTIKFLKEIKPEQIDGSETKEVTLKVGGNDLTFNGVDYLNKFALPNVHFHTTAAYLILRHNGLDIGKKDFLGEFKAR